MRLFQFFYGEATRRLIEPEFIPLESGNTGHWDALECVSIHRVLKENKFTKNEYIGFFCPLFSLKTGLTGRQVREVLAKAEQEVVSFSSSFEQIASYPNSFLQGDSMHPGLLEIAQDFLNDIKVDLDLSTLVQDQTRIIFRNYFAARYDFWVQWLDITERLLKISEDPGSDLGQRLNSCTPHQGIVDYPMKDFLLERIVSVLLETQSINAAIGVDIGRSPMFSPGADDFFGAFLSLDALKSQYLKTREPKYLDIYEIQRRLVVQSIARTPDAVVPGSLALPPRVLDAHEVSWESSR
ncbi:hypothetical protein [Ottowia thiooxydans]|uniref:Uncharacterized protein n=1 Tax=Ottowia thiooxydans TaxID=219182 RepID=A0ABV2QEJ9_9BURK